MLTNNSRQFKERLEFLLQALRLRAEALLRLEEESKKNKFYIFGNKEIFVEMTKLTMEIEVIRVDLNRMFREYEEAQDTLQRDLQEAKSSFEKREFEKARVEAERIKRIALDLENNVVANGAEDLLKQIKMNRDHDQLLVRAKKAADEGNLWQSAACLDEAIRIQPNSMEARQLYGVTYQKYIAERRKKLNLNANAIARIKGVKNNSLFLNKGYFLEAGISIDKVKGYANTPFRLKVMDTPTIQFLIILRSDIANIQNWQLPLDFVVSKVGPQVVRSKIIPIRSGEGDLFVDFYHERHWLQTIAIHISVSEQIIEVLPIL